MIPWRDHSFLKDEDDIRLAEDLRRLAEEPVTGRVMVIIMRSQDEITEQDSGHKTLVPSFDDHHSSLRETV